MGEENRREKRSEGIKDERERKKKVRWGKEEGRTERVKYQDKHEIIQE